MKKILLLITVTLALTACNSHRVSQFPSYKLTIEQGNELDPQALSQLQPGLTRNQVKSLLGSPLLTDIFHNNRWDYVFMVTRNGVIRKQAALTVFFNEEGVLSRVEGDAMDYLDAQSETQNKQKWNPWDRKKAKGNKGAKQETQGE